MCLGEPHSKTVAATTESVPRSRFCSKDVIPSNSSDPHSDAEETPLSSQFGYSICGFDLVLFQNLDFNTQWPHCPSEGPRTQAVV